MFEIASICLVVTALLAYVNHRFVGLPTTIGVMAISLSVSLLIIALNALGWTNGLYNIEKSLLESIDFSEVLMQGMLSFLLFAGALHVDISQLKAYRWQIGLLAIGSTVLSTVVVGLATWQLLPWLGLPLPLLQCLIFGALISPTDPIAVMSILRSAGAPKELELVIAGESLFNDGVGVVIFSLLAGMLVTGAMPTASHATELLIREAGGGLLLGAVIGGVCFALLRSIDQYQVEVLITLAAVMGGYALASHLHVSGPLAMVVSGLIIGNKGRALAMSDVTRRHLDMFWELLDEILNAVLFVLIGMEIVVVHWSRHMVPAAFAVVAITLLARWLTVGVPVELAHRVFGLPAGSGRVLTWGGLRGGISVALVLSLPRGEHRDILLALTYCVVLWSILAQGLTMSRVVRSTVTHRS